MASSTSRIQVQTRIVLQAAFDGDLRILKKMAEQMDLGIAEDEEGANALHLAAHSGCLDCCKFLVEEVWIDVNSTTPKGTTPLVCAMFEGNVQVMKYLLDRGGNPRRKTPEGLTVLHAAAARGLCEPLKLLLSEGHPADIMLEDHGGTPLHAAASGGQDEAMKILLEHGADPNRLMDQNISALMLACCHKSLKCMKLLIEAGADVNGSYCGPTTLTHAVKNGLTDIVKLLLEAGADPNDPGEDGEIPIQLEARRVRMMESPLIRRQDAVPVGARITYLKSRGKDAFAKEDYHAALYFFGRDYQGAANAFKEALRLDPESDEIKRALGEAMESKRSYTRSEDMVNSLMMPRKPMMSEHADRVVGGIGGFDIDYSFSSVEKIEQR
ncbi:hypothetical protein ACQ4PT_070400 [Festuca glaucescens]